MQIVRFGNLPPASVLARKAQPQRVPVTTTNGVSFTGSDTVLFGSKSKIEAYLQAQQAQKARHFRQVLSDTCLPAIPGADAITGLDVLEMIREYLTEKNKPLQTNLDVDNFLTKFLALDTNLQEQKQLSETLKKILTEDWPRLGLMKSEYKSYGGYTYTLTPDAVRVIESLQDKEPSTPANGEDEARRNLL